MVLSRTFAPLEFGIVAALNVFYLFVMTLSEGGLNPTIINLKKITSRERNGLFTFTFLFGCFCSLIFLASSEAISNFYSIERIKEITPFFAVSVLMLFINSIPIAFLQKEKKFFNISVSLLIAEVSSSSIAILLTNFIDPLQALASKIAIHSTINFIVCFIFSSQTSFGQPRFGSDFSLLFKIFYDAKYQYAFSLTNFSSKNIDNVLVGKFLGVSSLSIYDRAYLLMKYPIQLITFALTPAIQPVITNIESKDDIKKLHDIFILRLSIIAALAGLFCFVFSEQIVLGILGNQWNDVVPIFKILTISLPLQIVYASHGGFFQAMGKFRLMFILSFLSFIFFMAAFIYGVYNDSLILLCWGFNFAFLCAFMITYTSMYSMLFNKGFAMFLLRVSPCILAFVMMTILI